MSLPASPRMPTYFYPRPPRGGRLAGIKAIGHRTLISIHALREEGDLNQSTTALTPLVFLSTPSARRATTSLPKFSNVTSISIHALREEGDQHRSAAARPYTPFLSTPSARRATADRSARREDREISIHALREEGDVQLGVCVLISEISIHALREEGDEHNAYAVDHNQDFYPRPPRGGRLAGWSSVASFGNFYPRPPRGGRLQRMADFFRRISISIHALREEGDQAGTSPPPNFSQFLSTPSARRATAKTEKNISAFVSL